MQIHATSLVNFPTARRRPPASLHTGKHPSLLPPSGCSQRATTCSPSNSRAYNQLKLQTAMNNDVGVAAPARHGGGGGFPALRNHRFRAAVNLVAWGVAGFISTTTMPGLSATNLDHIMFISSSSMLESSSSFCPWRQWICPAWRGRRLVSRAISRTCSRIQTRQASNHKPNKASQTRHIFVWSSLRAACSTTALCV